MLIPAVWGRPRTARKTKVALPKSVRLDFRGALALATRGSARVCHLEDKVGGFDVGLKFDALRVKMSGKWDTQLFGFETLEDMIQKFCFLGDDRNIAQVWVEGRCVKDLITKA